VELFAELAAANPTFYANPLNPQSLNKYAYVYNNPLRYLDPTGHVAGPPMPSHPCCQMLPGYGWINSPANNFPTLGDAAGFRNLITLIFQPDPLPPPPPPSPGEPGSPQFALVNAQNAALKNKDFKPTGKFTYCNKATLAIAEGVGAPTGPLTGVDANQMGENLRNSAADANGGYRSVSATEAQQLADQGKLVIGAQYNPNGSGHVATVRPSILPEKLPPGRGPVIVHIGNSVGIVRENYAFRNDAANPVNYYTPR
jgi:hypothetical protein